METSFVPAHFWVPGAAGDIGPMQVTPVAAADAQRVVGGVPSDYTSNFYSNLIAGAMYVLALTSHYNVPLEDLGFAYKGGPVQYNNGQYTPGMWAEEKKWLDRKPKFDDLVDCLSGKP